MDQTTVCNGTDDKEEKRTKIGAWTSVDVCLSVCVMQSLFESSVPEKCAPIGFLRLILFKVSSPRREVTALGFSATVSHIFVYHF